jgi:hypothetical protein
MPGTNCHQMIEVFEKFEDAKDQLETPEISYTSDFTFVPPDVNKSVGIFQLQMTILLSILKLF